MGRDAGDAHTAALEVNEEQHVIGHQSSKRQNLDCEKAGCSEEGEVGPHEFRPGGRMFAHRHGRYTATAQNIADGLIGDMISQVGEHPDHPVSPRSDFPWPSEQSIPRRRGQFAVGRDLAAFAIRRICEQRAFGTIQGWCRVGAAVATSLSALRPSRKPISPSAARSASENRGRPFSLALKMRFSPARYSLRRSNFEDRSLERVSADSHETVSQFEFRVGTGAN